MKRGYVREAGYLLIAGFFVMLTIGHWFTGGLQSPLFGGYLMLVVFAGLLRGQRVALATAVSALLAQLFLFWTETQGLLAALPPHVDLFTVLLPHVVLLILTTAILRLDLTIRRNILTVAHNADDRTRRIVEASLEGYILADTRGKIVDVNSAYCQMVGYTKEELLQMNINDIEAALTPEEVEARIRQMVAEGSARFETRHHTKDGRILTLDVSIVIVNDPTGELAAAFVRNVIQERKALAALRESEARWHTLIEASPDAITMSSLDGIVLFCNQQTAVLHGYASASEIIGTNAFSLIADEDIPRSQEMLAVILHGQPVYNFTFIAKRADGSTFHAAVTANAILDEQGKPMAVLAITRDISAQVQAAQALRDSEQRIRSLVEQSRDGIVIADENGLVTTWNTAMAEITGLPAEAVVGRFIWDVQYDLLPETERTEARRAQVQEEISHFLQTGEAEWANKLLERVYTHPDRGKRYLQGTTFSIETEKGYMLASFTRDVTELKEAEIRIRESEERYRLLVNESPYAIGIHYEGKVVFANPAAARLLGAASPEALVGMPLEQLVSPSMWPAVQARIAQLLQGKAAPDSMEELFVRLDGTVVPVEVKAAPFTFNGRPAMQVIALDITERKEAEVAVLRSLAAEQKARQLAETVQLANAALSRSLDQEVILETLLDYLGQLVAYDSANVMLRVSETAVKVYAIRGYEQWTNPRNTQEVVLDMRRNKHIEVIVLEKKSLLVADTQTSPYWEVFPGTEHVRSWIGIPLVAGGEVMGLYSIDKVEPNGLTEEDVARAEMLASQAALALQNARLLAAEKEQRAVAEALKETAVAMNAARTLDDVLDAIIDHLEPFIAHDARDVMLIEGDMIKTVRTAGQIDVDYNAWRNNLILSLPETQNAQNMIAQKRPHYIPDVETDETWKSYPETAWVRSMITAPILVRETAVGFVNLYSTQPNAFTQEQANLLAGFAEQVATGLEKARLIEQLQRQNEYLEEQIAVRTQSLQHQYKRQAALAQIELVISEAQELQDVLRKIAMLLHEQLPVSKGASIILWDEKAEKFIVSASTVPNQDEREVSRRVRRKGGATRWIVENKKPMIVPDISQDPFGANKMLGDYKSYAYAGVPILVGSHVLGVLYALESHPKHYTQEEIEFMQLLASRAAIAIMKVRLYEQLKETNKLLEERKAELEARNKELETFTYSVSHDLKAPLRGIDGYSRLLLEDYADKLDDNGRFFLHTIRKATMQMTELIEDLLLYSRLERRSLQHEQLSLPELVEALLFERSGEIESRGVNLQVSVPETAVLADKDGLSIALRNLIDNALKFTQHQDTPVIEVGGRETEKTCIIWVRDNGVGFDMKFHQRIFEIFQRLHRAEEYPGTGIGLALVHKAMERMNGRVWAESTPGKGATFYLEIPKP
ncbi:MAG: hypothetical protein Kow0080_29970 [Candidatus Promineifilaceae bacterium]